MRYVQLFLTNPCTSYTNHHAIQLDKRVNYLQNEKKFGRDQIEHAVCK